jgi:hypothetical protein
MYLRSRITRFAVMYAGIAVVFAVPSRAAEGQLNLDQQIEKLEQENAALKKRIRVEQLEKENAGLRQQLGGAESLSEKGPKPRAHVAASPNVATTSPASGMYMKAASSAIEPRVPDWSGFYVGASGGLAALSTNEQIHDTGSFLDVFSGFSEIQQTTNIGQASGNTRGALADLSLGHNWQLGMNFVGGLQVDGSLSNLTVRESGGTTSNGTFTTSPGGTGTFTSTSPPTPPKLLQTAGLYPRWRGPGG